MSKNQEGPNAMAFYHDKGFVPGFKQASQYAGESGRIATMLDWVDARLATPPNEKLDYYNSFNPTPWDTYYTTMSAEYVGISTGGTKILIVAHGVGPMATLDGVVEAYRYQYADKTRRTNGGRISIEEFRKLENGGYGNVDIVDLEAYCRQREYPFIQALRYCDACDDPVLKARLGPRAHEYILRHAAYGVSYHIEKDRVLILNPYIISLGGPGEYWVEGIVPEEGLAYAHLLSVGGVSNSHISGDENRVSSWVSNIDTHNWYDGTRLIGVCGDSVANISMGPDPYRLLRQHWHEVMVSTGNKRPLPGNFYTLTQLPDGTWFTEDHKPGGAMDNGRPEYLVTSIKPIGEPVPFYTPVRHYYGFFKYAKSEVRRVVGPLGGNAYALVGEPTNIWKGGNPVEQTCLVQPYHVEIDPTRRLMWQDELANNFELMMELMRKTK